jgi:pimeloyl-ACP methyl ester carboxylesterase
LAGVGGYSERAVLVGPRSALVGVVTQAVKVDPDLPSIVVLNGGILPRSGQSRIYVTLSRKLASIGHRILRFDLSGIGDSPSRGDGLPPIEAAVEDIREALDWFVGADGRVILMGLCDGANFAAHRASIDRRIVGVVLIDPLIPRTARYRWEHLKRRLLAASTWREILNGTHPVFGVVRRKALALAAQEEEPTPFDPNEPSVRATLSAVYRGLAENEVEVFAVFTGSLQHRHCYREQLLDAFPDVDFGRRLQLEYIPAHDHHLEWPPHRAWLIDQLMRWVTKAPFVRSSETPAQTAAPAETN